MPKYTAKVKTPKVHAKFKGYKKNVKATPEQKAAQEKARVVAKSGDDKYLAEKKARGPLTVKKAGKVSIGNEEANRTKYKVGGANNMGRNPVVSGHIGTKRHSEAKKKVDSQKKLTSKGAEALKQDQARERGMSGLGTVKRVSGQQKSDAKGNTYGKKSGKYYSTKKKVQEKSNEEKQKEDRYKYDNPTPANIKKRKK